MVTAEGTGTHGDSADKASKKLETRSILLHTAAVCSSIDLVPLTHLPRLAVPAVPAAVAAAAAADYAEVAAAAVLKVR